MNFIENNERALLLRYHEVALKGANRGWFEEHLAVNARKLIEREFRHDSNSMPQINVHRNHGRIIIECPDASHYPEYNSRIRTGLERLFGLSSYSPMRKVPTTYEDLIQASLEEVTRWISQHGIPKSFRVRTRRSDKALPETSNEIDRIIGSAIHDAHPQITVDLENPEFSLGIEIRFNQSYIWTEKIRGTGGLPVGTNGRVLSLISGGLDSPVAAIQILRRGSPCSFIHFYGTPFVGEDVLVKIEDLVRIVNRYQPDPQPLHIIPFGKIQERIALVTNPKMRTVLYRRMMLRISCALAKKIKAQALVTGESLGQVASQTLENLSTINAVADLPILRPLIAYDKDQIIDEAQKWGTYETSIQPAVDCCTLFADRHPSIRTTVSLIEEQEAKFPVEELVQEAISQLQYGAQHGSRHRFGHRSKGSSNFEDQPTS